MKRLCLTLMLALCCAVAVAIEKSSTIVTINGLKYYVHTVKQGETLYALAKSYQVAEQVILSNNPVVAANGLKREASIKIPYIAEIPDVPSDRKLRKTFEMHYVSKGETLYAIARKYAIPIQTIITDNPNIDPIHLRLAERILIRKKQAGEASESGNQVQWEEYKERLNSVAEPGSVYHIVQAGETLYALSHRFGLSEAELSSLNGGIKATDLKVGAMIKVPGSQTQMVVEQPDTIPATSLIPAQAIAPVIKLQALQGGATLHVALLLPLSVEKVSNSNYLEFYQGFLLGLDSVKRCGYSVDVTLFNTGHNATNIEKFMRSPEFLQANLIVGPIYEDVLQPVLAYAEQKAIPVVSPLANFANTNSEVLFQMSPVPARKYEKVANLLDANHQVTLIYTNTTDKEFEKEILAQLGDTPYARHYYKYEHQSVAERRDGNSTSDMSSLLRNGQDNVFIVMANDEVDVDRILAALASANTNIVARGATAPQFVVLGNARWNRYNNIDRTMFFKNRVLLLSSYHAKRDATIVTEFDSNYIQAFGSLPTLYAYRGYDTAIIFCPGMYQDIESNMAGRNYMPLQTTYTFDQEEGRRTHINRNWMRVNYNSDFTITIE